MKILTSKTLDMKKKKIHNFALRPFCQIRAELANRPGDSAIDNGWTNAYKTHYSDNKVKCLERQIELKLSAKLKNIHDGKGAEISVAILK